MPSEEPDMAAGDVLDQEGAEEMEEELEEVDECVHLDEEAPEEDVAEIVNVEDHEVSTELFEEPPKVDQEPKQVVPPVPVFQAPEHGKENQAGDDAKATEMPEQSSPAKEEKTEERTEPQDQPGEALAPPSDGEGREFDEIPPSQPRQADVFEHAGGHDSADEDERGATKGTHKELRCTVW